MVVMRKWRFLVREILHHPKLNAIMIIINTNIHSFPQINAPKLQKTKPLRKKQAMNFIDNAAVDVGLGDYKMTNAVTPNEG